MNAKTDQHYWFKSGSLVLFQNAMSLMFGFGSFYLLVRMLDKNSYGIWTLFLATTTIIDLARSGLVQNALIRYLSSSSEQEYPDILSASFFISAMLMICCIVLNISLAHYFAGLWHYEGLVSMFYVFNIVYFLQGVLSQLQWIEQANLRFSGVFVTNFIKLGGYFGYVLICFLFHLNLTLMSLIYVQAISVGIATGVEYFFVKKFLFFSIDFKWGWIKKLFNYGKYAFGTSISAILAVTIDQMMLGALLSPAASGAFNIAIRITNLAEIPTNTFATIVFPQSSRRSVTEGHHIVKYLYEKSVGIVLALLIPIMVVVFFFPGFFVHIIAGSKYPETIPILRITTLYCLIMPFGRQFGTAIDSIGKPYITFTLILLSAIFILVLNFILIKQMGIMGAVYASLIGNTIAAIAMLIILYKLLGVRFVNAFKYASKFYPDFFRSYIKPVFSK